MNGPEEETVPGPPGGGRAIVPAAEHSPSSLGQYAYGPIPVSTPEIDGSELAAVFRQCLHIVVKRRWIIASVLLAITALGTVKALLTTPLYASTVKVQIDREPSKLLDKGMTAPVEEGGMDFLRTQFELLKGRGLAERVVSKLSLNDEQDFFKSGVSLTGLIFSIFGGDLGEKPASVAELQERAISIIASRVEIKPVPGARLVDITYYDPVPVRAQRIASAYAEAYVASTVDKRFQANAYAKTFLEDQIKQLKLRLEELGESLARFCRKRKNRRNQRQGVNLRKQPFGSEHRAGTAYIRAHQERAAFQTSRELVRDQPSAVPCQQDRGRAEDKAENA